MTSTPSSPDSFRVVIAGGGVAAVEAVLALRDMCGDRVAISVIAPNSEFVYRPMTVREPFSYAEASHYPLAKMLADAGAELVAGKLDSVEPDKQIVHTEDGGEVGYDALILALGAKLYSRYEHAVTIDDRRLEPALHGLIQDVEGGYLKSIAFVAPGRMAWPLPLYELALMTAGRAYDSGVELETTIVTSEDSPLAIFGQAVSDGVAELLAKKGIRTIAGYAEIPEQGHLVINPGDRRLRVNRVVALPELYGPCVRGLHVGEHGFIPVNRFCRVENAGPIYAAGDAVDFPVKQGGISTQQADVAAESIAKLAGADIDPQPFHPVVHGVLLTDERPRYLSAKLTGGHGFASEFSETPLDGVTQKIAARYLAPYLERFDRGSVTA